jgi:hypothetical protein
MAKTPKKSDDWNKFEKAVDTLLRTPPQPKKEKPKRDSKKGKGTSSRDT